MEATKFCPACGVEVPQSAARCKECFHDFSAAPRSATSRGWLVMLAAAAMMAVIGVAAVQWIQSFPTAEKTLVDGDSRTIQWVRQYPDNSIQTEQLRFDDIDHLEYVNGGASGFEIVAVTTHGDRKTVLHSVSKPLQREAQDYSEATKKPLRVIESTPTPPGAP